MRFLMMASVVLVLGFPGMVAAGPSGPMGPQHGGRGLHGDIMGGPMMAAEERESIHALLDAHRSIRRTVEEVPGGVRTRTVTTRPELVEALREHVRQMAGRLERRQVVRPWDRVFRDVFEHADEVTIRWEEIEGGIEVTETSANSDVIPLIRAHARKVDSFVAGGRASARPPWAGGRARAGSEVILEGIPRPPAARPDQLRPDLRRDGAPPLRGRDGRGPVAVPGPPIAYRTDASATC